MSLKRKKTPAWLLSVVPLCSFLSFSASAQDTASAQKKREPMTEQLITMVEHNSEIRRMLVRSVEAAKEINPD
jgi:hypothetical protein